MPYQFFIALRYLKAKKKHKGISFNTVISIGGVALGVMALIIVLSVMTGFQDNIQKKILGVNAHIVILNSNGPMKDYMDVMRRIKGEPHVLSSAPFILGQVMLASGERVHGVVIRGIDPDKEITTTNILKGISRDALEAMKAKGDLPPILIGKELSRNLGLFPGDRVNMISPVGAIGPLGITPKIRGFRVAGIFESGMYEYDANLAYINLKDAQGFFNMPDEVTGIELKVDDIYRAEGISKDIQQRLGFPYFTRDWMQMNKNLFSALKLEKITMFIILILIILVASFNIVSTLVMLVIEKAREIAILKAMGATSRGIMSIFMIQGLIIGVIGTVIGVIGGYAVCYLLKTFKFITLPADIYNLSHLPVNMRLSDFILISTSAIIISFLATLYPSWQAARLNPVEPLRYE